MSKLTLADLQVWKETPGPTENTMLLKLEPVSLADLVEVIESEGGERLRSDILDEGPLNPHISVDALGTYAVLFIPEEETPE